MIKYKGKFMKPGLQLYLLVFVAHFSIGCKMRSKIDKTSFKSKDINGEQRLNNDEIQTCIKENSLSYPVLISYVDKKSYGIDTYGAIIVSVLDKKTSIAGLRTKDLKIFLQSLVDGNDPEVNNAIGIFVGNDIKGTLDYIKSFEEEYINFDSFTEQSPEDLDGSRRSSFLKVVSAMNKHQYTSEKIECLDTTSDFTAR